MAYDRRKFITTSGLLVSGLSLSALACNNSGSSASGTQEEAEKGKHLDKFGLQLYTLRDDLPKDPKGILKQAASFGYKQIEGYEGDLGLFWGMTNKEFKAYMDELGMDFISSHCDTKKNFEEKAAQAAEIGMKYLISPWEGPQKSIDDFKKIADNFNSLGEICKKNGIRFAYHNHGYSFVAVDGQLPQDVMMQNTDAELVDFEMDIYWVVTAGADPQEWLKKYPNRFRLCHVKDRAKNAAPEDEDASCDLGTGSIDFKTILKTAADNGMEYYIVEQEKYENTTPIKSAQTDAEYLSKLVI